MQVRFGQKDISILRHCKACIPRLPACKRLLVVLAGIYLGVSLGAHQYRNSAYSPVNPALALPEIQQETGAHILLGEYRTDYSQVDESQAANIELAAAYLRGRVVPAGYLFSFNSAIGPYTEDRGFGGGDTIVGDQVVKTTGGGVCQVAGTLHSAALLAGLAIVERHNHSLSISYMPPGQDAAVTLSGGKDYRFRNNTAGPLVIWTQAADGALTVQIFGTAPAPKATLKHEILESWPPPVVERPDSSLAPGQQAILQPGIEGRKVRYWLELETDAGISRKELGIDVYGASPRVIAVGAGAP